jgi:CRP-like cAMP-binding protein
MVETTVSISGGCANELFGRLDESFQRQLQPFCDRVLLKPGERLFSEGQAIHHLYYPESGAIALMGSLPNGQMLQVGLVDRHGVAGLPPPRGEPIAPCEGLALLPGSACRMRVDAVPFALRHEPFRRALDVWVYAQLADAMQLNVCNSFHPVDQRLARWLLVLNDVGGDDFAITHDTLAMMLGVRRPSITLAALAIQNRRAIEYQYGHMRVRDRHALEEAACECYFTARSLSPRQTTEHL